MSAIWVGCFRSFPCSPGDMPRAVIRLDRCPAHMPDKQAAMLIATMTATQKITHFERGIDFRLSRAACENTVRGGLWILQQVMNLLDAAIKKCFFSDGCAANRLTFSSHQQAEGGLSTAAGGLGLTSAVDKHFAKAVGSVCRPLPRVLDSLTEPLGGKVLAKLAVASPV